MRLRARLRCKLIALAFGGAALVRARVDGVHAAEVGRVVEDGKVRVSGWAKVSSSAALGKHHSGGPLERWEARSSPP